MFYDVSDILMEIQVPCETLLPEYSGLKELYWPASLEYKNKL